MEQAAPCWGGSHPPQQVTHTLTKAVLEPADVRCTYYCGEAIESLYNETRVWKRVTISRK